MNEHPGDEGKAPRAGDRRRRPTRPWDALTRPARRRQHRRAGDLGPFSFVDRYDESLGVLILMLLVLTLTDGILTMILIDLCCEEANPVMALLIERGPMTFILGKYLMTAVCLPVLLVFQHHRMFRTRFRVRHLFPAFVALYLLLLGYQIHLLRLASEAIHGRSDPSAMAATATGGRP
ncbi:DUF5658 family protein [Tautonia plasticadhaerens]|uniref:DUF5658 domain-containing protein n=1 Tax=Tautonia plasticadhaerens TaxID=2527974 RepID=A0A518HFP3_9BACT|nr:DUF5658 family protein [Tautonia plasticadhaerens]QDV39669.1 hypothetical protein ElP_76410 [Tautonia plasticadhaerens]